MLRRSLERLTGYWTYKAKYLPIGTDLRIDLTRNGLGDPGVIFDVGANIGQTHARFRREFPKARIYCFEPVRKTFAQLERNVANDPLATLEQLALGDRGGVKEVHTDPVMSELSTLRDDLMGGSDTEIVDIDTVDAYCRRASIDRIDLLKIDTEGYELPVLNGAEESLRSGRIRAVFAEVGFERANARNTGLAAITEHLAERGYFFYGLYDVRHFPDGRPPAFGNALFIRRELQGKNGD